MKRVFVDTSAWIAHFNGADEFHTQAKEMFMQRPPLITSNAVLHETIAHLTARVSKKAAQIAGDIIINSNIVDMYVMQSVDEQSSWALCKKYNLKISFVDMSNIIVMQKNDIDTIFTFDRDFKHFNINIIPKL